MNDTFFNIGMMESEWRSLADEIKYQVDENQILTPASKGYYYTNVETLKLILEKGDIYSTNFRYLNDPSEWQYGFERAINAITKNLEQRKNEYGNDFINIMSEVIGLPPHYLNDYSPYSKNPFENNFSEIFTISFTTEDDLISQWDRYSKESGVVLELDFSLFKENKLVFVQESKNNKQCILGLCPYNVLYEDGEINKVLESMLKTMNEEFCEENCNHTKIRYTFYRMVRYYASFIKNYSYRQEKEIRLSLYPIKKDAKKKEEIDASKIEYTIYEHVLKPHVPIFCTSLDEDGNTAIEKCGWPIRSIKVGPGYNQESVYQGIIHRLECQSKTLYQQNEQQIIQTKLNFFLKALEEYIKQFTKEDSDESLSNRERLFKFSQVAQTKDEDITQLQSKLENLLNESKEESLSDIMEKLLFIKQRYYEKIFLQYEKNVYCTSDGIIVKRSNIPYIFS